MMKFYDLGNNKYKIVTTDFGLRQGSLRDVIEFAVFDLGLEYDELLNALVMMNKNGHDAADFGFFGGFIFSFNSKELQNVG